MQTLPRQLQRTRTRVVYHECRTKHGIYRLLQNPPDPISEMTPLQIPQKRTITTDSSTPVVRQSLEYLSAVRSIFATYGGISCALYTKQSAGPSTPLPNNSSSNSSF